MSLRGAIAGLAFVVASSAAGAATTAYVEALGTGTVNGVTKTQDLLYSVDLGKRTASVIGPAGQIGGQFLLFLRGLSFSADGKLYAVDDALKVLVQINPATGLATLVGPLNLTGAGVTPTAVLDLSMSFTCDGKAWLASATTGNFWQVNTASGATTLIGNLGSTITGLAAKGTALYGTGSQGNQNLFLIDTTSAKTTLLGAYGNGAGAVKYISPGFDETGQLWAVLDNVPPYVGATTPEWNNLAQIAANGSMNNLGNVTGPADLQQIGLVGLAIAPPVCASAAQAGTVGAPVLSRWSMLLLGLAFGVTALVALRFRLRRI